MMENVIDLAQRRLASPTRTYVTRPVDCDPFIGTGQPQESAKIDDVPSVVATAAKAMGRAQMWQAELTPRQRKEALLIKSSLLTRDEVFQKVLQRKADHLALSMSGQFQPLPDGHLWIGFDPGQSDQTVAVEFDAQKRPVSIWPWLLAGVAFAIAIAVTPAAWMGL